MDAKYTSDVRAHAVRTLAWWLAGSILLLAALWAGPSVWAAGLGSCGQATVPGPCAVDDGVGTAFETGILISVLANDEDRSNTGLHVSAVTTPANGTAVRNGDNTITYTPQAGFSGADEFSYTVRDGLAIEAQAAVMVFVAAQEEQQPVVRLINPLTNTAIAFADSVRLADGAQVAVTTTVYVPSGAFTLTLRPTDTLAIVFQPVITPTGNVNVPPAALMAGQFEEPGEAGAASLGYRWTQLTFSLEILLNHRALGHIAFREPLTLEVNYDQRLMAGRDPYSLAPYYWTGSTWSQQGINVVKRNAPGGKISFTVDHIVGEMSLFARSNLLFMPALRAR